VYPARIRILAPTLVLALAGQALAHHTTPSPVPRAARTRVRADIGLTFFDLEGHSGDYETLTLAGDWRLPIPLLVGVRVPLHLLHVEGEEGQAGLGDLSFLLAGVLVERAEGSLWWWRAASCPPATTSAAWAPATPSWRRASPARCVAVTGSSRRTPPTSSRSANHDEGAEHHHTFIDPHDERQLELGAGVVRDTGGWFAGAALLGEIPLVEESEGARLLAGLQGGLQRGRFRWTLTGTASLVGEAPYTARVVLGAEWRFSD
jgi:hypothetical protein